MGLERQQDPVGNLSSRAQNACCPTPTAVLGTPASKPNLLWCLPSQCSLSLSLGLSGHSLQRLPGFHKCHAFSLGPPAGSNVCAWLSKDNLSMFTGQD